MPPHNPPYRCCQCIGAKVLQEAWLQRFRHGPDETPLLYITIKRPCNLYRVSHSFRSSISYVRSLNQLFPRSIKLFSLPNCKPIHLHILFPSGTVLFRPGWVNLQACLCGVPAYTSVQSLDFLASTKNPSFPDWKQVVPHPQFPDGHDLTSVRCFSQLHSNSLANALSIIDTKLLTLSPFDMVTPSFSPKLGVFNL